MRTWWYGLTDRLTELVTQDPSLLGGAGPKTPSAENEVKFDEQYQQYWYEVQQYQYEQQHPSDYYNWHDLTGGVVQLPHEYQWPQTTETHAAGEPQTKKVSKLDFNLRIFFEHMR